MSQAQAQTPAFPTAGDTPTSQRMLAQLGDLIRQLVSSAVFLLRPTLDAIIIPRPDRPAAVRWGSLDRLLLTADFPVHLPRIEPRYIGVALELILLDTGNVAELVPTGLGANRKDRPLINGASTLSINTLGLYRFMTDGQNWFGGRLS